MSDGLYRELLLGCGRDRRKRYSAIPMHPPTWRNPQGPTRLDVNLAVAPDLWCDLDMAPPWRACSRVESEPDGALIYTREASKLESDYWDEIHAYEVLEHLGRQGDEGTFFAHFFELWRILKPNGYLVVEVPSRMSGNLWGDPGHKRAIVAESLAFLDQGQYALQVDGPENQRTTMSDYRDIYSGDFQLIADSDNRTHYVFVLQAIKPSRWERWKNAKSGSGL